MSDYHLPLRLSVYFHSYYDARLEAAVNNKNGSTLTDVKVDDNLTFNKNVINILSVDTSANESNAISAIFVGLC